MCHFSPLISSQKSERELSWKRAAFRCALQSGVGVRKYAEASGTKIIMFLSLFFAWRKPEQAVLKGRRFRTSDPTALPLRTGRGMVTHFLPVTAALTCPTSSAVKGCLQKPARSVSWPPAQPRHSDHVTHEQVSLSREKNSLNGDVEPVLSHICCFYHQTICIIDHGINFLVFE